MTDDRLRPRAMDDSPNPELDGFTAEEMAAIPAQELEDVALLMDFLNGHLSPDEDAAVRRRLESDERFLAFAAPMLLAWNVAREPSQPPPPRPPGEMQRHWDEFTKRAGFVHQKKKARRRRLFILGIALLLAGGGAAAAWKPAMAAYRDWRLYETVPYSATPVTLRDGSQVLMSEGARLRASRRPLEGNVQGVKLRGRAQFRVIPIRPSEDPMIPAMQQIMIATPAGKVGTWHGEFLVETRGDTTWVELFPATTRAYVDIAPLPTMLALFGDGVDDRPVLVREGEHGRMVRGQRPERVGLPNDPNLRKQP